MATADAGAVKIFGIPLFERASRPEAPDVIDPKYYAAELDVSGSAEVEDAVKSASELWRNREDAVGGSAGLLARAKGDYRRIMAALYNQGHYGGSISITLNGRQAAEIEPGTEFQGRTLVAITVDPGPAFAFGEAAISNTAPPPLTRDDIVDDPASAGFAPGLIAKAGAVRRAGELASDAWRQQGYPKATVAERNVAANHPSSLLNVRMHLDPGPHATYGPVDVEGNERMIAAFIARQAGLLPGQEYDPDDIERAIKRLNRLGVFTVVKVQEADEVGPDGTLPFTVTVQEKPLRRIGAGVTFSTVDGAGAEAYWLHRNLFGRAESLKLTGSIGGIGETFAYDEFDYFLGATFRKPGFTHPDTDLTADVHARREFNDTYLETSVGASLGLERFVSDNLTLRGGFRLDYARFQDAFGVRHFLTSGIYGGLHYDNRDSKSEPTRGVYFDAELYPYYEWQFGNFAARFEAEGRTYYALDADKRYVLAGRLKLGTILGPSVAQTPPSQLFFAGGGGSVRGYAYNNIGVPGPAGTTIGGLSLVEGSGEIRARFTDTIGAAAFVDFAAVGSRAYPDFANAVKVGAGIGLRYYTALGPIRLDFAVPLNRGPGDPSFGVYAGIGQSF
ncbi:MAG: outer membrane protein assembly factor [Brucellaceae bacterium]|nr:outer membrane protein assembly factor [Brucellaceae bacterium]